VRHSDSMTGLASRGPGTNHSQGMALGNCAQQGCKYSHSAAVSLLRLSAKEPPSCALGSGCEVLPPPDGPEAGVSLQRAVQVLLACACLCLPVLARDGFHPAGAFQLPASTSSDLWTRLLAPLGLVVCTHPECALSFHRDPRKRRQLSSAQLVRRPLST